ncbi:MAG TPA: cobyric acid synthase [Gemmatimonadaceae bacterium]|nr:cobyric acid synthase [Gemmatimonadaceae bacterium]
MPARALMILGTASHVGKSLLTAALGRILSDRGFDVAPFKAQNMALNSAATPDGLEIGRAQALQAEACRVAPSVHMNPVLLKPSSDIGSQVVVRGEVWGQLTAADYHAHRVEELFPIVVESYRTLAREHDIILLEGAGSPAEINLKAHDIVNLRMATAARARCLLVGDIDRGGVFASLFGTMQLLERRERARIAGFAINKFRGDRGLLEPGIAMMEQRLRRPCVGVVPYIPALGLDEEDGVALDDRQTPARAWRSLRDCTAQDRGRALRIGVVALPHMANFTDFQALAAEPSVEVAFLDTVKDVRDADVVVLPGTKQTLADLRWLEAMGIGAVIHDAARESRPVVGVCGGMQMLGVEIADPLGVEGGGTAPGLGLLPIVTTLRAKKVTVPATAHWSNLRLFGQDCGAIEAPGYEIHMGDTTYRDQATPFAQLRRAGSPSDIPDGAVAANAPVIGSYLHGLFDGDAFRHAFITAARHARGLAPPRALTAYALEREQRLNRLAACVAESMDVDQLLGWIGLGGT